MKLQAKILLNLPKSLNTICLSYNTYEKATFDQYLVASIVYRCVTEKKINGYIDSITGKGSLNNHFKKLATKIMKMDKEAIERILENSMYPITKIDKTHKYIYYPDFNISIIGNKVHNGNICDLSIEKLKDLLLINYDLISFEVEQKDNTKIDTYNVKIDEKITINLLNDYTIDVSSDVLMKFYESPNIDFSKYKGIVKTECDNYDNWNMLTEKSYNAIVNNPRTFVDQNGNLCILNDDYIKNEEILNHFGLYFYKERRLDFNKNNSMYCSLALKYLFDNSYINEIKTKTLIAILKNVNDFDSQKTINYILSRKESKELSLLGLDLICRGIEKGWSDESLIAIKKFASSKDLSTIYRINNEIEYSLTEIISIENQILNDKHQNMKKNYFKERKNKIRMIQDILGLVIGKALREKVKKIPNQSDKDIKEFTKLCNNLFAHNKESLSDLGDEKLKNKLDKCIKLKDIALRIEQKYSNYL